MTNVALASGETPKIHKLLLSSGMFVVSHKVLGYCSLGPAQRSGVATALPYVSCLTTSLICLMIKTLFIPCNVFNMSEINNIRRLPSDPEAILPEKVLGKTKKKIVNFYNRLYNS